MANPRSLAWYHANKDKIDKPKKKAYMAEYRIAHPDKWKRTPEQREKINARRREKYAEDEEYRESQKLKSNEYNLRRSPEEKKSSHLKGTFGITIEDYDELYRNQDGKCAICGSIDSKTKLSKYFCIDHDHDTGKVRGLLCSNCNFALGHFQDNIVNLENAIKYLRRDTNGKVDNLVQLECGTGRS
ncbi:MAG: endonuclease VII domain-containing protein [Desulfitobacterium hafniense]|nr:endonuclease VII domain-containing protein [Desulfitobacterium hafniense]